MYILQEIGHDDRDGCIKFGKTINEKQDSGNCRYWNNENLHSVRQDLTYYPKKRIL